MSATQITPDLNELLQLIEASGPLLAIRQTSEVIAAILNLAARFVQADAYAVWRRSVGDGEWLIAASAGLSTDDTPCILTVPLSINGETTATIAFYFRSTHTFSGSQKQIVTALGILAASAFSTAEVFERDQEAHRIAELLNRVGPILLSQLGPNKLVQSVTDLATKLTGAEFGAFFHNVINEEGESYSLYSLSGAARESFANLPMPRNTAVFDPIFRGEGVVRSSDITQDPRYGKSTPHHGMPKGHPPVKSFLAAPVISRSGEVLGGLFFGHSVAGKFTEWHEAIITGIAAQSATAMDNAQLFEQARWAQSELKRSNEELRRANRDLETFAYSASHDLQEPLRNIAIYSQLLQLQLGERIEGDAAKFLNGIREGALRMETLIKDLLAYSRATKYTEGAVPSIHAGATLTGVLQSLKARIEQNSAVITADELPVVFVHEVHLAEIFQNLISNALKYRSREIPRVHVSVSERDGWWVFSVADNGMGIDPKYRDQIFELFKRLHGRDEYAGSGVGLAICQRIVEHYGGRIWVDDSAPGKGSVFCFTFPDRQAPVETLKHVNP